MNNEVKAQTGKKNTDFDATVWVNEHGNYLFAYAFSRVRDEATAEDILQETLLSALQSLDSFHHQSTERTWLTGILKHKIVDYFRKSSREGDLTPEERDFSTYQYLFNDKFWNDHWTPELTPLEWHATPEKILEESEFCGVLSHCLGELPKRIANAFTLREMEGFDSTEICGILGISKDNYWTMLHRARLHLRRCLEFGWFRKEF